MTIMPTSVMTLGLPPVMSAMQKCAPRIWSMISSNDVLAPLWSVAVSSDP